jgi:hypothetical protein
MSLTRKEEGGKVSQYAIFELSDLPAVAAANQRNKYQKIVHDLFYPRRKIKGYI